MRKWIVALFLVAPFFPAVTMHAQGKSPSGAQKTAPVFGGNGLDRVPRDRKPPPPTRPADLGSAVFTDIATILGKVEPGSTYVHLTPTHPAVANKGVLLFWDASLVETGENYAFWGEKKLKGGVEGSVDLWIWSPASRNYGIDCSLSGYQFGVWTTGIHGRRGGTFKLVGPDGSSQFFDFSDKELLGTQTPSPFDLFNTAGADVHLVFGLTVGTKGWYGFQIIPLSSFSWNSKGLAQWAFFSCNVLNAAANVPQLSPKKSSR